MSTRTVACGALAIGAAMLLWLMPAAANDAAHKMAEKFAGEPDRSAAKTQDAKSAAAAKATEAEKAEAERSAREARKKAAQAKADAARKAAEAKRRVAAKAAEEARRAVELRRADEAEMLARARREAEEMKVADEELRLAEEARRLIEQAEKERAKAEAILASEAAEQTKLAEQRAQETRNLSEKLKRVRQIRDARLAARAKDATQEPSQANNVPEATPPTASLPTAAPEPAPAAVAEAPSAPAKADEVPSVAAQTASGPAAPPATRADTPKGDEATPQAQPVAEAREPTHVATGAVDVSPVVAASGPTRVAVLLVMVPGDRGIRRHHKVADPVLCSLDGCYVSTGTDSAARFMPGRQALSFGNTWGARSGACRETLGCVFRGVQLGMPGFLRPVDMRILKHDRRRGQVIAADSGCHSRAGRLSCAHGIYADDYTMWIVPESVAQAAGAATLQRAVDEGLNGPKSAALGSGR